MLHKENWKQHRVNGERICQRSRLLFGKNDHKAGDDMGKYPIMLHVKNKNVIVVGGGKVAYKKITSLLIAGADITVISPTVISPIKKLVDEGQLRWHQKTVKNEDLRDAFVIIAATNNEKINKLIAQSSSSHQLVNTKRKETSKFLPH